MKVSKAQVQENRARIVETAAMLFRQRGYDGIGVAELMAAAGLTHGGFYKHFGSKADLMAEAAAESINQSAGIAAGMDMKNFVEQYLSRQHRDAPGQGCTMAALGGDAARQSDALKAVFAAGIEHQLAMLAQHDTAANSSAASRAALINTFAQAVGALVLSRACPDDSALADEILQSCQQNLLRQYQATPTALDSDAAAISQRRAADSGSSPQTADPAG